MKSKLDYIIHIQKMILEQQEIIFEELQRMKEENQKKYTPRQVKVLERYGLIECDFPKEKPLTIPERYEQRYKCKN
ncbi:hypothetical protein GCM10007216_20030 [Thalassobacillus devorans]|uniref:Fur-regulated basic protein FbpA n=1 Tax=Thalassobacillus devorans TaxID=279813 RepID=A0ABQ1P2V9_9BACI|nr:hypothetical protein [Thalassobacillus devorans]NIK28053.1 hypothetical protein [Thalassobacillus devorans]GGC89254.1 hypothetical protein GCM10007216_20030 [Thalassobacillus devorans]